MFQVRQVGSHPGNSCRDQRDLLECFHSWSSWFNSPGSPFTIYCHLYSVHCTVYSTVLYSVKYDSRNSHFVSKGDSQFERGGLNCQLCHHSPWIHPPRGSHLRCLHRRHPDLLHRLWPLPCTALRSDQ